MAENIGKREHSLCRNCGNITAKEYVYCSPECQEEHYSTMNAKKPSQSYKKGANDKNYGIFIVASVVIAVPHVVVVGRPHKIVLGAEGPVWLINIYLAIGREPLKIYIEDEQEAKDCFTDLTTAIEAWYSLKLRRT